MSDKDKDEDKDKKIEELNETIKELKRKLSELQDIFGYEINQYFFKCNSIRNTTEHFFFEDVQDCYEALKSYNGCSDPVQDAIDYEEICKEFYN
jgi:hypothetical protein